MSLNIKDPEAHRLAQAISRETGESMTKVVIEALRERHGKMEQKKRKPTVEELMALVRSVSKSLKGPAPDHDTLLYDEHGLPK